MRRAGRWVASLAGLLASLCANVACRETPAVLLTPQWSRLGNPLVRTSAGALLLRQRAGAVYRLELATRALTLSDDAAWDAAPGPPVDCAKQLPAAALRYADGRFLINGTPVPLAGARAGNAVASADGRVAAIWSSNSAAVSFAPALAQGHRPPFYVDVIALPDGRPVHPPAKLALHPRASSVQLCFTEDGSVLVAQDVLQLSLDVVALQQSP